MFERGARRAGTGELRPASGQVVVFMLPLFLALSLFVFFLVNVGDMSATHIEQQNAADSAALAVGSTMARGMNQLSAANITQCQLLAMLIHLDAFERTAIALGPGQDIQILAVEALLAVSTFLAPPVAAALAKYLSFLYWRRATIYPWFRKTAETVNKYYNELVPKKLMPCISLYQDVTVLLTPLMAASEGLGCAQRNGADQALPYPVLPPFAAIRKSSGGGTTPGGGFLPDISGLFSGADGQFMPPITGVGGDGSVSMGTGFDPADAGSIAGEISKLVLENLTDEIRAQVGGMAKDIALSALPGVGAISDFYGAVGGIGDAPSFDAGDAWPAQLFDYDPARLGDYAPLHLFLPVRRGDFRLFKEVTEFYVDQYYPPFRAAYFLFVDILIPQPHMMHNWLIDMKVASMFGGDPRSIPPPKEIDEVYYDYENEYRLHLAAGRVREARWKRYTWVEFARPSYTLEKYQGYFSRDAAYRVPGPTPISRSWSPKQSPPGCPLGGEIASGAVDADLWGTRDAGRTSQPPLECDPHAQVRWHWHEESGIETTGPVDRDKVVTFHGSPFAVDSYVSPDGELRLEKFTVERRFSLSPAVSEGQTEDDPDARSLYDAAVRDVGRVYRELDGRYPTTFWRLDSRGVTDTDTIYGELPDTFDSEGNRIEHEPNSYDVPQQVTARYTLMYHLAESSQRQYISHSCPRQATEEDMASPVGDEIKHRIMPYALWADPRPTGSPPAPQVKAHDGTVMAGRQHWAHHLEFAALILGRENAPVLIPTLFAPARKPGLWGNRLLTVGESRIFAGRYRGKHPSAAHLFSRWDMFNASWGIGMQPSGSLDELYGLLTMKDGALALPAPEGYEPLMDAMTSLLTKTVPILDKPFIRH